MPYVAEAVRFAQREIGAMEEDGQTARTQSEEMCRWVNDGINISAETACQASHHMDALTYHVIIMREGEIDYVEYSDAHSGQGTL